MATIIFFVDFEEGHLFPTFGLSRSLKERGHLVHYVGMLDVQKSVIEQGFEFHPILENLYPIGFRDAFKKKHLNKENYTKITFLDSLDEEFPALIEKIKPQGLIMSTYLSLEALFIYYKYGIKPIIFMPVINSNPLNECRYEFGSLGKRGYDIFQQNKHYHPDIRNRKTPFFKKLFPNREKYIDDKEFQLFITPAIHFEQIIACPEEFEIPERKRKNVHYAGPCIRNSSKTIHTFINELKSKNKKVVYVSLGTQTERIHNVCEAFYLKVIDLMKDPDMSDYHVILSSRSAHELHHQTSIPENMTILNWVDSLQILEISSAMITHGGLGLVKESIFYGVPLIILPDKYDQPLNADRIEYHRLGVKDSLKEVTTERLKSHLQKVTTDPIIQEKIQEMKAIFRKKEESQESALLIERLFHLN